MSLRTLSAPPSDQPHRAVFPISQRAHFRYPTSVRIDVREHRADGGAVEISGVTANLSRGGALALLSNEVALDEDASLLVRFTDNEGNVIAPKVRWGTALRSTKVSSGYEVAIRFEDPLEQQVLQTLLVAARFPRAAPRRT